jgi:hypothetical protein
VLPSGAGVPFVCAGNPVSVDADASSSEALPRVMSLKEV